MISMNAYMRWGTVLLGAAALCACTGTTADTATGDGGADSSIASDASGGTDAAKDAASTYDAGADVYVGNDAAQQPDAAATNHRPDDSQCTAPRAAGNCALPMGVGACTNDSECTDGGANGRCTENMGGAQFCSCTYDTCVHDTDCPMNQLCVCHDSAYNGGGNVCMPGNCRVDYDCGGFDCSPTHGTTGCGGVTGYYCHTARDTCVNDSDCADAGSLDVCAFSMTTNRWECGPELLCP
jgi:hypothetical protein